MVSRRHSGTVPAGIQGTFLLKSSWTPAIIVPSELVKTSNLDQLTQEAGELAKIIAKSVVTAKKK